MNFNSPETMLYNCKFLYCNMSLTTTSLSFNSRHLIIWAIHAFRELKTEHFNGSNSASVTWDKYHFFASEFHNPSQTNNITVSSRIRKSGSSLRMSGIRIARVKFIKDSDLWYAFHFHRNSCPIPVSWTLKPKRYIDFIPC